MVFMVWSKTCLLFLGYTGGFGSDLMKKDLGLALSAGADSSAPLPMGITANSLSQSI
jgi:3-hydroxyisobutyrate dehydrogenase-like beta-hydroxyacid dehydrogenase